MRIEYDPKLIEESVFLACAGDPAAQRNLHQETDPLYAVEDAQIREERFEQVFADWFRRLKLDRVVEEMIAECPLISPRVHRCIVRSASGKKGQSAELFVRGQPSQDGPCERTLLIQLRPQSLAQPQQLVPMLRRELLHVSDLLDERFGYVPESLEGASPTQNLIRDRYRILWDVYVEGRLAGEGKVPEDDARYLQRLFKRAFGPRGEGEEKPSLLSPTRRAFDTVLGLSALTHSQLLQWAKDPELLLGPGDDDGAGPLQAKPCPLCTFPTYDWYELSVDDEQRPKIQDTIVKVMRSRKPDWTPQDGICRQCAEACVSSITVGQR